jgi:dTDP-4-dehydrorhamnose reductase|tara:strand:+ start:17865 stop:18581 length:717 start_codon:yes stop_codon:yes gene_type:complete
MKKLLISGANGKFAKQVIKYNDKYNIIAPLRTEMDIVDISQIEKCVLEYKPDIFLHSAALTRPMVKHINNPDVSIKTNIIGTSNVVMVCMKYNIKLVYLSTDYVYPGTKGNYKEEDPVKPFNSYAWSKLGGECAVQLYDNSLILRMSMSEKPFPHPKALVDVKKSMIYNDEAAKIVLKLLEHNGIINVGGKVRFVYDFVKESIKDIEKIYLKEIKDVKVASNPSMNIDKMKRLLDESK